ncbi:predicted protein [Nematostella vectensis]|uniref:Glycosyl transferase family 1 domain-containing protein n=1 Tax=Nematostella vectensis TaxID=45351 RepID=A7T8J9_NEMVE|nr:predicted protein [Nematostella vectensis]|eukprot:XP_001619787.1 hypothetical protein NEMVEDRAFT_v1g223826 [Nematostella vectensis]
MVVGNLNDTIYVSGNDAGKQHGKNSFIYSNDKGVTWSTSQGILKEHNGYVAHYEGVKDRVYASVKLPSSDYLYYYSKDNGTTWKLDTIGLPHYYGIKTAQKDAFNIKKLGNEYVVAYNSLAVNGAYFKKVTDTKWMPLAFPANSNKINFGFTTIGTTWFALYGSSGGNDNGFSIAKSTDNGKNWEILTKTGLPSTMIPSKLTSNGTDKLFLGAAISVSKSLKEDTLRLFTITNEIQVIHNFIDENKFIKAHEKECQRIALAQPEERILTHISNFRPVKRINDVIRTFALVRKEIPSKLLMVGEGPDRRNAELLAKRLGIKEDVLFLGNSTEVDELLCYTDVFLLPSETESFGFAALEAMAAEAAVISTNTGGLPEVNIHGVTGYLSTIGDVEDMAANTIKILKDDVTLNEFKQRAKAHTKQFSLQNILPVYEEIYESLKEKVN